MIILRRKQGEALFIVSVVAIGTAVMALAATNHQHGAPAADASKPSVISTKTDWPSMTFTYRVDDYVAGPDNQPATQVWEVTYQDARHWRKELIESSTDASTIGTVVTYVDGVSTTAAAGVINSATGLQDAREVTLPAGSSLAVERWLVPLWQRTIAREYGASSATPVGPSEVSYSRTVVAPCEALSTGQWMPKDCSATSTYPVSETFAFRVDIDPSIPTMGVTTVDGATIWRVQVTDVVLRPVRVERSTP